MYRVLWFRPTGGAKVSYGNLNQICNVLIKRLGEDARVRALGGGSYEIWTKVGVWPSTPATVAARVEVQRQGSSMRNAHA